MKPFLFCATAVAGLCLAAAASPPGAAWLPCCPFHEGTGLLCPGCGSTRALQALAEGDAAYSLRCNALLFPMLAWAVLLCTLKGRNFAVVVYGGLGVLLAYMLLRNLPFAAFLRP